MRATDAMAGFTFLRKKSAEALMSEAGDSTDGWFYMIELLLRAERDGFNIYELPLTWVDDVANTKVHVMSLSFEYLREMLQLRHRLKAERNDLR